MTASTCLQILPETQPFDLNLQRQAMVTLPDAAKMQVTCTDGALWITLDNDGRDAVLNPGEVFTTTEHRRAVVYALKASRFTIAPVVAAVPRAPARRPFVQAAAATASGFRFGPRLAANAIWY